MSSGSPVIRPRAKLSALWRVVASIRGSRIHLLHLGRIDRHVTVGGKVDEALREIRIMGGKRRLDLALRDRRIESSVERMIGNPRRIVETAKRRNRTRHGIGRGHSERDHGHGKQRRPATRNPRPSFAAMVPTASPACATSRLSRSVL